MPWAKALAHRNASAEMDLNPEDQRGEDDLSEIRVFQWQSRLQVESSLCVASAFL